MSSINEQENNSSMTSATINTITTTADDGSEETVTTKTSESCNSDGGRQQTASLTKEICEQGSDAATTGTETNSQEITTQESTSESYSASQEESSSDNSSSTTTTTTTTATVQKQMETMKSVVQDGSGVIQSKQTEVKEETEKIVNSVKDEAGQVVKTAEKTVKEQSEKVNTKVQEAGTAVKNAETQLKDGKDKVNAKVNEASATAKKTRDQVGDEAAKISGTIKATADGMNKTRKFEPAGPDYKAPITITIGENDEGLFALNKIRSMHGQKPLVWNAELENKAKLWALKLADGQSSAELSGTDNMGELVFVAKGTSECSRMSQAVLEWYKSVSQYKFSNPSMVPVSDNDCTFTQLVWDSTTDVGISAVYREDTRTSYIVANLSPPGNYGDVRNYLKHVKAPTASLPPKVPKIEDLFAIDDSQGSPISNMGSIFGVLCHWCVNLEDKPEIKTIAARPMMKVVVPDDDADGEKTDATKTTKHGGGEDKQGRIEEGKEAEENNKE